MSTTADIKNGSIILHKNSRMKVVEFQHVKPGKGPAFVRTKLKNEAIKKGEEEMLDILTKIKNGHKIFGMSWGELCKSFLDYSKERVDTKRITPERLETLTTQTNKWIIPYLNKSTRLSEININSFLDYGMYSSFIFSSGIS